MPTPGQAIRAKCMDCLNAETGYQAFDCISLICPLYPAHRFRGKPLPKSLHPKSTSPEDDPHYEAIAKRECLQAAKSHKLHPKQRPSKKLIRLMCDMCNPDTSQCTAVSNQQSALYCPLHPLTQFQPGRQPKRTPSPKVLEAATKGRASILASSQTRARTP